MVDDYLDTLTSGMSFIILLPGDTFLQFMFKMRWIDQGLQGSLLSWGISLTTWAIIAGVTYAMLGLKND